VHAGDGDVVIQLPAPKRVKRLAGRVMTDAGAPVAQARLSLWIQVVQRSGRVRGGRSEVVLTRRGPSGETDEHGAFAFEDVPRDGIRISVTGDDVVPRDFAPGSDDDLRALELVVNVRCHLRVELTGETERADSIAVATEEGDPLDLLMISHRSTTALTDVPLVAGRSGVVSASSTARRLYLLRDGEVVEEHRIELLPGDVNELRY